MNGLMMFDGFLGNDECEKFLMFFLATKMTMTDLPLSNLNLFLVPTRWGCHTNCVTQTWLQRVVGMLMMWGGSKPVERHI